MGQAKKDLVYALIDCVRMLLKGGVAVSAGQLRGLEAKRRDISELLRRGGSLESKKRILQRGGFLGALLGPLISGFASLFGGGKR